MMFPCLGLRCACLACADAQHLAGFAAKKWLLRSLVMGNPAPSGLPIGSVNEFANANPRAARLSTRFSCFPLPQRKKSRTAFQAARPAFFCASTCPTLLVFFFVTFFAASPSSSTFVHSFLNNSRALSPCTCKKPPCAPTAATAWACAKEKSLLSYLT